MTGVNKKLAATMLLLCSQATNRTQLNKLVFFADVASSLKDNQPITGEQYNCLPFGPVPQGVDSSRNWLVSKNYLNVTQNDYVGWREYSYVATDSFDIKKVENEFTSNELDIIRKVKKELGSLSATELSTISHEFKPWKDSELFSEIDLESAKNDAALKDWLKEKNILA